MSDIPEDVLADILSRLPPKTLLRFRCVSKPWRALIDSNLFIKLHLDRSKQTHSFTQVILTKIDVINSVSFDSLENPENPIVLPRPLTPPAAIDGPVRVIGCCNGLVLLSDSPNYYVLWNPSTREHLRLPELKAHIPFGLVRDMGPEVEFDLTMGVPSHPDAAHFAHGFGYDCVTDDYKVVRTWKIRVKYLNGGALAEYDCGAMVYSLKSGRWRNAKDFENWIDDRGSGLLAHGKLHWTSRYPEKDAIVAFDLATEKSCLLPEPEKLGGDNFFMTLGFLKGCFSMTACYLNAHQDSDSDEEFCPVLDRIDVWLMMDYGVRESWSKAFSVFARGDFCPFSLQPVTFSRDESRVLLVRDSDQLLWYDIGEKSLKKVTFRDRLSSHTPHICVGSLVRLDSNTRRASSKQGNGLEEKGTKKTRRRRDDFLSKGFKLKL